MTDNSESSGSDRDTWPTVTYRASNGEPVPNCETMGLYTARECDDQPRGVRYVSVWNGTIAVPVSSEAFLDGPPHVREWLGYGAEQDAAQTFASPHFIVLCKHRPERHCHGSGPLTTALHDILSADLNAEVTVQRQDLTNGAIEERQLEQVHLYTSWDALDGGRQSNYYEVRFDNRKYGVTVCTPIYDPTKARGYQA